MMQLWIIVIFSFNLSAFLNISTTLCIIFSIRKVFLKKDSHNYLKGQIRFQNWEIWSSGRKMCQRSDWSSWLPDENAPQDTICYTIITQSEPLLGLFLLRKGVHKRGETWVLWVGVSLPLWTNRRSMLPIPGIVWPVLLQGFLLFFSLWGCHKGGRAHVAMRENYLSQVHYPIVHGALLLLCFPRLFIAVEIWGNNVTGLSLRGRMAKTT